LLDAAGPFAPELSREVTASSDTSINLTPAGTVT
jgi:hypothetical protein